MTPETLSQATGIPVERAQQWADILTAAMEEFGIQSPNEQCSFLAEVCHESMHFQRLTENLNYSATGLAGVWPKRFSATGKPGGPPNAQASMLARNPMAIANAVYGGRMGNTGPNDGWDHRGAGLIQLTGKNNQSACAKHFGIPIEEIGDWLRTPEGAARSAGWFWKQANLDNVDDDKDVEQETRIINGGTIGLPERQAIFDRAAKVLGAA